jgi:hypothetical protein
MIILGRFWDVQDLFTISGVAATQALRVALPTSCILLRYNSWMWQMQLSLGRGLEMGLEKFLTPIFGNETVHLFCLAYPRNWAVIPWGSTRQ